MSTKIKIRSAAAVVFLLAVGAVLYIWQTSPEPAATVPPAVTPDKGSLTAATTTPPATTAVVSLPPLADDPLAKMTSQAELEAILTQILLITDDAERLQALRQRLGMNISDTVYRNALAAYGNRADGERLGLEIGKAWIKEAPQDALDWAVRADRLSPRGGWFDDVFVFFSLGFWLAQDRSAATAYAREHLSPELLDAAARLSEALDPFNQLAASGEFAQLMRHANSESHGVYLSDREDRMKMAVELWAEKEPRAAAEYALSIAKDDSSRESTLDAALEAWTATDPDAALAFAQSITNEADRVQALTAVLPGWARKYPDVEVDVSLLPEYEQAKVIEKVTTEWAMLNPYDATQYALSLDDPEMRRDTLRSVADILLKKDPTSLRAWALALPAGETRDTALNNIAWEFADTDLATAETLANDIQDVAKRNSTLESVISRGLPLAPARALQLANKLPEVRSKDIERWSMPTDPKAIAALRAWVESAQAAGRITYPKYPNQQNADPAVVANWERQAAEEAYRKIISQIDQAATRRAGK